MLRFTATSICTALIAMGVASSPLAAVEPTSRPAPFRRGADVSMLPEIERAGGVYLDRHGRPGDAISVLRDHGVELFRLRLFVDPTDDFNASWGATQDLAYVRALAKRVRRAGGAILLDLHYSDTWADGKHQAKPKAWAGQSFEELERTVETYTASVLKALADDGCTPDVVQIGNEIAGGLLFPDGQLLDVPKEREAEQWGRFARLLDAGARGVRGVDPKVKVMVHIHGGGRPGLPAWFFGKIAEHRVDYDVIGLSFYPAWGDSIDALRANLAALEKHGKPVLLAEVAYPRKPMDGVVDPKLMRWPITPEGQRQFTADVAAILRDAPNGGGLVWWYPEARPAGELHIWKNGAEALFDADGRPQPAMAELGGKPAAEPPGSRQTTRSTDESPAAPPRETPARAAP